jgi:ABC-type sugar transport system substrate-binding protein
VLVAISAVLAACGSSGTPSGTASSSPAAGGSGALKTGLKVFVIPKNLGNPYFTTSDSAKSGGAIAALQALGETGTETSGTAATPASQIPALQAAITKGANALLVSATDPSALCPTLNKAMKQGITVVTYDSDAPACRNLFINQASTAQIGTSEVDLLAKQIHSKGEIAIVSAAASAPNQNAWIGFMKQELKKFPKMKLVSTVYGNDDPTTATQVTQGLLQHFPNLRGIISPTTVGILAAAQVVDTPAHRGKIAVTGLGTPNSLKKYVAGVPASGGGFAYISCGTWSLVGMELDQPVLTEAGRRANFSNETGIDGTIRYLRNVMGLWLLQESIRAWSRAGPVPGLAALLGEAARVPPLRAVIDPGDPAFLPPGDMPSRIAAACRRTGQRPPPDAAATVRCILDSLALAHRRAILDVQELTGRAADTVHIVGGGARNPLLCQLTADACGLPVIAGPVEATALGNVLVQARSLGTGPADLGGMRALLRDTQRLRRFEPDGDARAWDLAARRTGGAGGRPHPASI